MEASDSECFESADEDFPSEDEESVSTKTVVAEKKEEKCADVKKVTVVNDKVCSVKDTNENINNDIKKSLVKNVLELECTKSGTSSMEKKQKDKKNEECSRQNIEVKTKVDETNKKESTVETIQKQIDNLNINKVNNEETESKKFNLKPESTNEKHPETKKIDDPSKNTEKPLNESKDDSLSPKDSSNENMWDVNDDWVNDDWQNGENITKKPSQEDEKKSNVKTDNLWEDDEKNWKQQETSKKQESEDDLWETDEEWESVENVEEKESCDKNAWGGWGNWDVSSILTTATQSVSSITTQVSQGLTSVIESGIGAPDPEEMARIIQSEKGKLDQQKSGEFRETVSPGEAPSTFGFSHFGNLVKLVESTSTKVISGGLDTLETIGKKTMEVLQEGDPGLKKKRALLMLHQDKPILSQVLREAKEREEQENAIREQQHLERKTKNYEILFDDFQGLVHLEALEMLSRQCDIKLETLKESYDLDKLSEMQETMEQVKELCELPEEDEDEEISFDEIKEKLESGVNDLNVAISYDKLVSSWSETNDWLSKVNLEFCDENELHQQAIETLAQITAIAVEQFHKGAELLMVKEHRSTADEADSLVLLTTTLKSLMFVIAGKFTEKINELGSKKSNKEKCSHFITNVFFEAANSSSYIKNAFQLLIPILQVGAV